MTDDTADDFTALLMVYLWRNEPGRAASGTWFWLFSGEVLGAMASYRN